MRPDLPAGTVTFLFTDVEGSTKLLHELGAEKYADALADHRKIVREACAARGGVEVDTQGDAFFVAFPGAPEALEAAKTITEGLSERRIRLRMGLHTGTPLVTEEGYVGDDVHFAARISASGHGGQVVLSPATRELLDGDSFTDLGEHRLKDIEGPVAIYQLGRESFPPLKTISNTNLPRPASSFVGREAELAEVLGKVEAGARLLTLTGPGGSGKTRLALEAAATLVPEYKAGVFWVGLAALRDATLVTEAIAQVLGAKDGLAEHVGERELCLLLDNLEQVVEAAPEVSSLLQACPNLTVLCTSRELLRIQGEVEYAVPPLASPEAVALFCDRSQLEPTDEVSELCARLDNLPLAVELAAARTKALSPMQIRERLSQRLDLLKGGRDADPRQQTLRATVEWSHDLLSQEEQRLFRALSVFSGGCTLQAAEEVCEADLDTLQSLVEKSLLRFTASDASSRYWMLETIREYAGERLEEAQERIVLGQKHAELMLKLAESAEPELEGAGMSQWMAVLGAEENNIRAAFTFLEDTDQGNRELELAGSLQNFWYVRGNWAEGRRWSEAALEASEGIPTIARAKALNAVAGFAEKLGDPQSTKDYAEQALVLSRELGYARGVTSSLMALSLAHRLEGDRVTAAAFLEEASESARASGDAYSLADATAGLAFLAMEERAYPRAIALAEEAREAYRQIGDPSGGAYALTILGSCLLHSGQSSAGLEAMGEALPTLLELGFVAILAGTLGLIASATVETGNAEVGATIMGFEGSLRQRVSLPRTGAYVGLHAAAVADLRRSLGDERYEEAFAAGGAMTLEEAVGYAMAFITRD
jgi:predicted ATPase